MSSDFASLARDALIEELESLRSEVRKTAEGLDENGLWAKPVASGNSIGHLILHLTGNLNHFVGAKLGNTGYIRDREREFTETEPPSKLSVLADLDAAVETFRRVVSKLGAEQLAATHPEAKFGSVFKALVHFVAHFALHRGQMSYLARLVSRPG